MLAYALGPIDLIPDFIPVVGHLDDLVLVPVGLLFAFGLIPTDAVAEAPQRATDPFDGGRSLGFIGDAAIATVWIAMAVLIGWVVMRAVSHRG